ncbi:MAG: hypothetical protein E2O52_00960 [Gammaproteobacteria bacterium]|nr:MAG: hypothetical protein E2O52_00960 [Gammaproteobacteria bacterium]
MKNIVIFLVLTLLAGATHAMAVPFAWSGGSLSATNAFGLARYSASSGTTAALDVGETATWLNFGSVSVVGSGAGTLSVSVDFTTPETTTEAVSGSYSVLSFFFFSNGKWEGGSTDFAYTYLGVSGLARLAMYAFDTGWQKGSTFTFAGAITNLSQGAGLAQTTSVQDGPRVALAEPGPLALIGFGFLMIGLIRKRQTR